MNIRAFSGRIIFDHLGKTGGMAVTAWLRDELGNGVVAPNVTEDHRSLIRRYGGIFSILSAHTYFQGEGLDPRYQYITILRSPIDRVISWLYYAANTVPNTREFSQVKKASEEFLRSEGDIVPDLIFKSISNYYVDHFSSVYIDPKNEFTESQKLSCAIEAVKKYDVVGIYEQMSQFLAEVADLVGLPRLNSIPRLNKTKERPLVSNISHSLRSRIVELNQLDIQLYEQLKMRNANIFLSTSANSSIELKKKWVKYEPIKDRVLIKPDLTIAKITLREGYDIFHGQVMTFILDFRLAREVDELEIGISILDESGRWAFGVNSTLLKHSYLCVAAGSYRVIYQLIANLPEGKYCTGFAFEEKLKSKVVELAWHDNLCEFQIFYPNSRAGIGYANLPTVLTLLPVKMGDEPFIVSDPIGQIILKTPLSKIQKNEDITIEVEITNRSIEQWYGNQFFPINLSYHWIDVNGEILIYDGVRTALPVDDAIINKTIQAKMKIVGPPSPGTYTLFLTIVQENVGWFDEFGSGFVGALKVLTVD